MKVSMGVIFRTQTRSLEVSSHAHEWKISESNFCMMCEKGADETLEHMMLERERNEYARTKMLEIVAEEIGVRNGVR